MRIIFPASLCLILTTAACGDDAGAPASMADGESGGSTSAEAAESTGADPSGTEPDSTTGMEPDDDSGDQSTGQPDDGPIDVDLAWLDAIEGQWLGGVDPTPIGPIPQFGLDFAWEGDGSLHTYVENGEGASFDFRFVDNGDHWVFYEEGTLPGGLAQSYELHPVQLEGNRVRWVFPDAPDYLSVEIEVDEDRFQMDVSVLGRSHAAFDLTRM